MSFFVAERANFSAVGDKLPVGTVPEVELVNLQLLYFSSQPATSVRSCLASCKSVILTGKIRITFGPYTVYKTIHIMLAVQLVSNIEKRKIGFLRLQEIRHKAKSTSKSFVQAPRTIGSSCLAQKLLILEKLGELVSTMEITIVACQSEHEQKDVTAASDPVTNTRTLLQ